MALYGLLQNDLALRHPLWVDLPVFSSKMNTLLAISHGAYLSVKSVDKTQSSAGPQAKHIVVVKDSGG